MFKNCHLQSEGALAQIDRIKASGQHLAEWSAGIHVCDFKLLSGLTNK